ncbi:hypothetical protein ZWY2020_003287 [Hordeum vulgare]|nr:hypothetical protein ZWY2020_003287 [Hordeum vulgare]
MDVAAAAGGGGQRRVRDRQAAAAAEHGGGCSSGSAGGAVRVLQGAGRGAPRLGRGPERSIMEAEARGAAAGVGARVPTLYSADRERTEVVLCELLIGLNYICPYEQQQSACTAWEPRQSGPSSARPRRLRASGGGWRHATWRWPARRTRLYKSQCGA